MLSKYYCTGCNVTPLVEREIFFGCSRCGNKLFKLIDKKKESIDCERDSNCKTSKINDKNEEKDLRMTTISVNDTGVYQIDVDKLLKEKDSPVVAVSDKNGVIHIKL